MFGYSNLQKSDGRNRVTIIGGGIVGAALAAFISESSSHDVILIDRSLKELSGSTAAAPGLVGQLNESTILTKLAKESVKEYKSIPNGWDAVGALEIYTGSHSTIAEQRMRLAHEADLEARIIDGDEAVRLAPDFVSPSSNQIGLHFPSDGTADAIAITKFYTEKARTQNTTLVVADYLSLDPHNGTNYTVRTSLGTFPTNQIIFATGIWTSRLLEPLTKTPLPIIPVAHPYIHFQPRPPRPCRPPFVRWPEAHVYARDHGAHDGFGTYDHRATATPPDASAVGPWLADVFEPGLHRARHDVLAQHRGASVARQFNGVFAVTPDNLPLVGALRGWPGVWVCAAVWITHAAGAARVVARMVLGEEQEEEVGDGEVVRALDPGRFEGEGRERLEERALARYNDIYNSLP